MIVLQGERSDSCLHLSFWKSEGLQENSSVSDLPGTFKDMGGSPYGRPIQARPISLGILIGLVWEEYRAQGVAGSL